MSAYYEPPQWPPAGQAGWEHQTPPPARSGANSAIPREEPAAFAHQLEEVDRALDNLVKSGKMFAMSGGGRRESLPPVTGPARTRPDFDGRSSTGPGSRPHSAADYGDARGPHQSSNLQNFYATQRHQSSRGSNEAEQMMQAKRRMAAQRERELRNYHQEQQYNRKLSSSASYGSTAKSDRALSPGSMSEEDRRKLIAQQRSALYREGSFAEAPGYVDETGTSRPGLPAGPAALRGHSPLTYDYGRAPPSHPEGISQAAAEGGHGQGSQSAGPNERSRANSNSSPQSNPAGTKGMFDAPGQQSSRTSASSPGGSPPRGSGGAPGNKPGQGSVAPIGTRPSVSNAPTNPALNKRSTTPLPSPLSQGYSATGNDDGNGAGIGSQQGPSSATTESANVGLSGWGGRPNGWGSKSGLGVQASVSSVWG
ncbi:hypothetical protein B0H67DRAFT_475446 [Lasiosphaeris hirsuta]|uniref:Uncharacterized protein n=1 Tax=Lasiosphaeris hirsuta TaxID=260670 RepID=A0AA40E7Z1_9PEZI|nr:hypothetical protein B0H67DRAFT_475446 [Lasiosphaeris hirsuta]